MLTPSVSSQSLLAFFFFAWSPCIACGRLDAWRWRWRKEDLATTLEQLSSHSVAWLAEPAPAPAETVLICQCVSVCICGCEMGLGVGELYRRNMNADGTGLVCLDAVGNWGVCVAWCHGFGATPRNKKTKRAFVFDIRGSRTCKDTNTGSGTTGGWDGSHSVFWVCDSPAIPVTPV